MLIRCRCPAGRRAPGWAVACRPDRRARRGNCRGGRSPTRRPRSLPLMVAVRRASPPWQELSTAPSSPQRWCTRTMSRGTIHSSAGPICWCAASSSPSGAGARPYRPPAWDERGRAGAIEVPAGLELVLIEGVGAGRHWRRTVDAISVQSDFGEAESVAASPVTSCRASTAIPRRRPGSGTSGWRRSWRSWRSNVSGSGPASSSRGPLRGRTAPPRSSSHRRPCPVAVRRETRGARRRRKAGEPGWLRARPVPARAARTCRCGKLS